MYAILVMKVSTGDRASPTVVRMGKKLAIMASVAEECIQSLLQHVFCFLPHPLARKSLTHLGSPEEAYNMQRLTDHNSIRVLEGLP